MLKKNILVEIPAKSHRRFHIEDVTLKHNRWIIHRMTTYTSTWQDIMESSKNRHHLFLSCPWFVITSFQKPTQSSPSPDIPSPTSLIGFLLYVHWPAWLSIGTQLVQDPLGLFMCCLVSVWVISLLQRTFRPSEDTRPAVLCLLWLHTFQGWPAKVEAPCHSEKRDFPSERSRHTHQWRRTCYPHGQLELMYRRAINGSGTKAKGKRWHLH